MSVKPLKKLRCVMLMSTLNRRFSVIIRRGVSERRCLLRFRIGNLEVVCEMCHFLFVLSIFIASCWSFPEKLLSCQNVSLKVHFIMMKGHECVRTILSPDRTRKTNHLLFLSAGGEYWHFNFILLSFTSTRSREGSDDAEDDTDVLVDWNDGEDTSGDVIAQVTIIFARFDWCVGHY